MTESAAVGTRGFNTSKHKKYSSVGLLAPNMHARIVHVETGCSLSPGSCGELWLHGPAIMKGNLMSLMLLCHFGTNWVPFCMHSIKLMFHCQLAFRCLVVLSQIMVGLLICYKT